ncbi:substrate-binding periplasmic protein [Desulfosarcina ovata]|nr:ABC transporter substrate-binding protein [Desulfosarcina ovata]
MGNLLKIIKTACFCCVLFFSRSAFVFPAQTDPLLVMAFNHTISKPWKWKKNGEYVGPFIDVMNQVADRSGFRVALKPLPWKRALMAMEAGLVDGSFGGYKTPEREAFAVFLDMPIGWSILSIYVRAGEEFPFGKVEDLYGKEIGIVRGYTTSPEFDAAVHQKKIHIEETSNYVGLIRMLNAHRIEGIVGATSTIQAHLIDMGWADKFGRLPNPITEPKPIYICISKNSKIPHREKIIARMNQAMMDMAKEAAFGKIAQKYGYDKCVVFGCIPKTR